MAPLGVNFVTKIKVIPVGGSFGSQMCMVMGRAWTRSNGHGQGKMYFHVLLKDVQWKNST